jgi:hypothetical protein
MVPRGGIEPPTLRFSVRLDRPSNRFTPSQTVHQIVEITFKRTINPSRGVSIPFILAWTICSPGDTQRFIRLAQVKTAFASNSDICSMQSACLKRAQAV